MADSIVHKMVKVCKLYEAGLCTHGDAESVIINEVIKEIAKKYVEDTYYTSHYPTSLIDLEIMVEKEKDNEV